MSPMSGQSVSLSVKAQAAGRTELFGRSAEKICCCWAVSCRSQAPATTRNLPGAIPGAATAGAAEGAGAAAVGAGLGGAAGAAAAGAAAVGAAAGAAAVGA